MYIHIYFNSEKAVDDENNLNAMLCMLQQELLSNDVKNPIEAIEIYRNKDLVEKAFGNLKQRLNFSHPGVSSDLSLDGKLFVEFIDIIFLSYIKKKMQDKNLFKK